MTNDAAVTPTQDERLLGALAHASVVLPLTGILAPIIIWATQKEKSAFVEFQALQALAFQFVLIVCWFVAMACYMCSFVASFVSVPLMSAEVSPAVGLAAGAGFALPFLIFAFMFAGYFVFAGYGLAGAFMTFQGRPFRYVVVGDYVARWLSQAPREAGGS